MRSMTAFARVHKQLEMGQLCWELKTVNHRYLDTSFRLPDTLRFIEPSLRAALRDIIHRGKFEASLKYQHTNLNNQSMLINEGMINALVRLGNQLSEQYQLANDISASTILSWPGVLLDNQTDTEHLGEVAIETFKDALHELVQMRTIEGRALQEIIQTRVSALGDEIRKAKEVVGIETESIKDKLITRLEKIKMEVSEQRVEQEIALLLTKMDVTEELDRLKTHTEEVGRIIQEDTIAGRRLDFLMQELNREANTLSAKSEFITLTQCSVQMKVLIEQMREQIQNIE